MEYGTKISELRRKNKLTQSELGEKLNVTPQAVSKWENNLSQPDIGSLRKMSAIFNISLDELLNDDEQVDTTEDNGQKQATEKKEKEKENDLPVLGYCSTCKKPVRAGEFKTVLDKNSTQITYCNTCYNKMLQDKQKEEQRKLAIQKQIKINDSKKTFFSGIIWGIIAAILLLIGGIITYSQNKDTYYLVLTIILPICAFTMVSQIIWGNFIQDIFFFFCRSFKAPFGLIFTLDLDGIIWFLTVKLALWIIFGALSIAFFLLGLVVNFAVSLVVFPFTLPYTISLVKKGELD